MKLIFSVLFLLPSLASAVSFAPFQKILDKHLTEAKPATGFESYFDYVGMKNDPASMSALAEQKVLLAKYDPSTIDNKNEATAFWINAYNFSMVAKIIADGFDGRQLKIESVRDLGSFFNRYGAFTDDDINIGGVKMTLDDLEHGWLRSAKGDFKNKYKGKNWKDARIHFAVNCASVGCPPLRKKLYTQENVDKMLTENNELAFMARRHLHFDGKTLKVSSLFKWYKEDFVEESGSVQKYIARFVQDTDLKRKILATSDDDIEHIDYDWKLNIKKNF